MKVTVCFDDVKVIVPCGNSISESNSFLNPSGFKMIDATTSENESASISISSTCSSIHSITKDSSYQNAQTKVSVIIENAISRFKKAAGKSNNCVINVLHLQTVRDGGILDPDDYIQEVVEDKELLIAIYEEINYESLLLKTENITQNTSKNNISNSLNNSSLSTVSSTSTNCSHSVASNSIINNNNSNKSNIDFISEQFYTNQNYINRANNSTQSQSNQQEKIHKYNIHSSSKDPSNTKSNDFNSGSCVFSDKSLSNLNAVNSGVSNYLTMSSQAQQQESSSSQKVQYFNRVNSNRQSSVKNGEWSATNTDNHSSAQSSPSHILDKIIEITLNEYQFQNENRALGIHVVPTYDSNSQCDMGLVIQRIDRDARIHNDGRIREGDRIVELNRKSLIGVDFVKAQEIFRDTINYSNQHLNGRLDFKIVRSTIESKENERPIEIEVMDGSENNIYHDEHELQYEINKQNFLDPENKENNLEFNNSQCNSNVNKDSSFSNNNPSSVNMSALNTKKLGKKIIVQLIKGPQGLGFKLAARDNCSQGEFSPIYIKNILPKGAAITDGRLQRGDRLLEVNQQDMTNRTLHEAVNILRNTKLGSCVEIVVSRQITMQQQQLNGNSVGELQETDNQVSNEKSVYAAQLPREISCEKIASDNKPNSSVNETGSGNNKRQLLTFEIALNDTGSAGLGVSVKGKTKRIEENDCSIDLGIFIKTVINGGAASKDGQLKANDQLININGFSLLGKSNEEAMLILREAMQVESKPGHIQLTVSRKMKITSETSVKKEEHPASQSPKKQVVKVIRHGSPTKTPVEDDLQTNRFYRDAPNRRSMSEKRTKIGQSHTSNAISKYNRNLFNDSSSDSSNIQPKRSKTTGPILTDNNFLLGNNPNSKTLHRNFKPSYQKVDSSQTKKFPYQEQDIGSAEVNHRNLNISQGIVRPVIQQNYQNADNYKFKRMGSIDSVASRGISSSMGTNISSKIELLRQQQLHNQQQKLKQNAVAAAESVASNANKQSSTRRSISMESIPNLQNAVITNTTISVNQPAVNGQAQNNFSKYGTIGGYSGIKSNEVNKQNDLAFDGSEPVITGNTNRFRSINRSFRTAVDKSFDVPSNNSDASMSNNFKNRRNELNNIENKPADMDMNEEDKTDAKKLVHKKSLIETFQKLFKSSNKKNASHKQHNQQTQQQMQENTKPGPMNHPKRTFSMDSHQNSNLIQKQNVFPQPDPITNQYTSQTRF